MGDSDKTEAEALDEHMAFLIEQAADPDVTIVDALVDHNAPHGDNAEEEMA